MSFSAHLLSPLQVHLDISKRKIKLSNVFSSFAEERIKDRLEMSFSKPSRGGGEVERVEYDSNSGTALVTFLQPGGTPVFLSVCQSVTSLLFSICNTPLADPQTDPFLSVCVLV